MWSSPMPPPFALKLLTKPRWYRSLMLSTPAIWLRTALGARFLKWGSHLSGMPFARVILNEPEHGVLMIIVSSHPFDTPEVKVQRVSQSEEMIKLKTTIN